MNHPHRFYDWVPGLGTKQFPSGYNIGCKIVMEKGQRILLRVSRPINHRSVFFHCWLFRNLLLFLREMILRKLLALSLSMCGDKVLLFCQPITSQGRWELSACQDKYFEIMSSVKWHCFSLWIVIFPVKLSSSPPCASSWGWLFPPRLWCCSNLI